MSEQSLLNMKPWAYILLFKNVLFTDYNKLFSTILFVF